MNLLSSASAVNWLPNRFGPPRRYFRGTAGTRECLAAIRPIVHDDSECRGLDLVKRGHVTPLVFDPDTAETRLIQNLIDDLHDLQRNHPRAPHRAKCDEDTHRHLVRLPWEVKRLAILVVSRDGNLSLGTTTVPDRNNESTRYVQLGHVAP